MSVLLPEGGAAAYYGVTDNRYLKGFVPLLREFLDMSLCDLMGCIETLNQMNDH